MLTKDIRMMADEELAEIIKRLIEDRTPESYSLDYKKTLDIGTKGNKKELAKDVSAFANTQGGVLIYGVPEEAGDLPKPLADCGMEVTDDLPIQVENILLDTVKPPLRACIRVVELPEIKTPKKLLIIQHPESYWKPHMVEGYKEGTYYKRCNSQTEKMNEREVEREYLGREAARTHARDFFTTALFGNYESMVNDAKCPMLRLVACPVFGGQYRTTSSHRNIGESLNLKDFSTATGTWEPFIDGWRFLPSEPGNLGYKAYEIRLFLNKAICLNLDAAKFCEWGGFLNLDKLRQCLIHPLYEVIGIARSTRINGPVIMQAHLTRTLGLKCVTGERELEAFRRASDQLDEGQKEVTFDGRVCKNEGELLRRYFDSGQIEFEWEASADDLKSYPEKIIEQLIPRLATAFGLWLPNEDD